MRARFAVGLMAVMLIATTATPFPRKVMFEKYTGHG